MNIKNYLVILGFFILLDIPMTFMINTDMYMEQFLRINKAPMIFGDNMLIGALVSYLLLTLGLYLLVLECTTKAENVPIKGMIYGFIIYGFYNYVNLATINEYGSYETLIDTIWGALLCGGVSYMYVNCYKPNISS